MSLIFTRRQTEPRTHRPARVSNIFGPRNVRSRSSAPTLASPITLVADPITAHLNITPDNIAITDSVLASIPFFFSTDHRIPGRVEFIATDHSSPGASAFAANIFANATDNTTENASNQRGHYFGITVNSTRSRYSPSGSYTEEPPTSAVFRQHQLDMAYWQMTRERPHPTLQRDDISALRGEKPKPPVGSEACSIQRAISQMDTGARRGLFDGRYKIHSNTHLTQETRSTNYFESDLYKFSQSLLDLSPADRLTLLKLPWSSIRFSYGLILEHMLEASNAPAANKPHDLLEAAVEGLNHLMEMAVIDGAKGQDAAREKIMKHWVNFVAIGGVLKYYETEKGPTRGPRAMVVRNVLSNRFTAQELIAEENPYVADSCPICLDKLFRAPGEERDDNPHNDMAPLRNASFYIDFQHVRATWTPDEMRTYNVNSRSKRACLITWLPDFADVIQSGNENCALPNGRAWITVMNMHRVSAAAGNVTGALEIRRMGIQLFHAREGAIPGEPQRKSIVTPPEEVVVKTACGHLHHRDCMRPWLLSNGTCPNCRKFLVEWIDPNVGTARAVPHPGLDSLLVSLPMRRPVFFRFPNHMLEHDGESGQPSTRIAAPLRFTMQY